ncbi:hypothetical protein [Pleomorphomonas oryzae]|uniref:hypothetical protein n=1 Tax=Pleomorphomonas oryzae TaxID=261934 RepID=UPI000429E027|nr:hypothetical protein [Pleomorphomonas oryzae]
MITLKELAEELRTIVSIPSISVAENARIAAIEALAEFALYENDAERSRPIEVAPSSVPLHAMMFGEALRTADADATQAGPSDNLSKTEDAGLSISIGRSYEDGYGGRIRIDGKSVSSGLISPFRGDNRLFYSSNGRCNGYDRKLDLVREVADAEQIRPVDGDDEIEAPGEGWTPDPNSRLLTKGEAAALRAAAASASPLATETAGVVTFHEPEGREPFDEPNSLVEVVTFNEPQDVYRSNEPDCLVEDLDGQLVAGLAPVADVTADRPAHPVLTEPLQVGKEYFRRGGGTVNIVDFNEARGLTYPYRDEDGKSYTRYGSYLKEDPSADDLVKLVTSADGDAPPHEIAGSKSNY